MARIFIMKKVLIMSIKGNHTLGKIKPLCKPLMVCTTNGFVVDTLGPSKANLNDAKIMENILRDPTGLESLMQKNDICIVDRGFRNVIGHLKKLNYKFYMPDLKGKHTVTCTFIKY